MDDRIPVLATETYQVFRKLRTSFSFSFHLLVSTVISVVGIVLAATSVDSKRCQAYFIMIYLRCAFWLVTFIFDHIVKRHHEDLRMRGYHDFHRAVNVHKSFPLYIVSLWNTAILAVDSLQQHYYGPDFGEKCMIVSFLSPIVYITTFHVLENFVLMFVNGSYISKVVKFNTEQPSPDALRSGSNSMMGSVGISIANRSTTELLEKQADLISYLKDHNQRLNQKLMQINTQLRTVTLPPNLNI